MAAVKFQDQLKLKKQKRRLKKAALFLGASVAVLAGVVYLAFFAKLFDIRSVEVDGAKRIAASDLESVANSWLDKHFFWIKIRSDFLLARFQAGDLRRELSDKFIDADSISLSWPSLHELKISVSERKPVGIWCVVKSRFSFPTKSGLENRGSSILAESGQDQCFYFDGGGLAYAEAGHSSGFLVMTISDYSDRDLIIGDNAVSEKMLGAISAAKENLKKINLEAGEISIPAAGGNEFDIKTLAGFEIMFDDTTGIASQVGAMNQILSKLSAEEKGKLQYFDLRIQDRVYYK